MCLLSETVKPKKAEKDIRCYKVLFRNKKTKELYSPYMSYYKWELNKEHKAERARYIHNRMVMNGYFHTFKHANVADHLARNFKTDHMHTAVVYECKIPAGTYYFTGLDSQFHDGYASKKLVILEEARLYEAE